MVNLKKLLLLGGASVLISATALTGCQSRGGSGDRTAGRMIDDKQISGEIENKLKQEPVYKFSDVDVKTFAGVVQLSGFVTTEEQKRRAGEIAQGVSGVQRVENSISLKPNAGELSPTGRTNQVQQQSEPIQSDTTPPSER